MEIGVINNRWTLRLPDDRVEFHAERPGWEAERLASCAELMKPEMVVYDIGAECGDFTALYGLWVRDVCPPCQGVGFLESDAGKTLRCERCSGWGHLGTVVPVDPQPAYWPSIKQTWEANALAPLLSCFVGFASDETELYPPLLEAVGDQLLPRPGAMWPECAYGEIAPDFGFRHLAQQTDGTRQVRIDDIPRLLGARPPDAIVMDIEGAELRALRGALDTLVMHRPLVWVSVHEPIMLDWYGHTLADLQAFMVEECNYSGELLGTSGGEDYYLFRPEEGL